MLRLDHWVPIICQKCAYLINASNKSCFMTVFRQPLGKYLRYKLQNVFEIRPFAKKISTSRNNVPYLRLAIKTIKIL